MLKKKPATILNRNFHSYLKLETYGILSRADIVKVEFPLKSLKISGGFSPSRQSRNISLHKLPASACLISVLVEELRQTAACLGPPPVIVLPTRRLGTALIAALTSESPGRAIVAPITFTLEDMIRKGVDQMDSPEANALLALTLWPANRIELVLERILHHETYKLLHPGHAHEIAHFFGELEKNSLASHGFGELRRIVAEDVYRGEESLGMVAARVAELEDLYSKLTELLNRAGAVSSTLWFNQATLLLTKNKSVLPWGRMIIAGFTSASPAELALLSSLDQSAKIILHDSPPVYAKSTPLKELLAQLPLKTTLTDPAASSPEKPSVAGNPDKLRIVAGLPGITDEIAWVVDLAAKTMASGTPASRIGLIITDEEAYAKPLRAMLADTLHKNRPLSETGNIAVPMSLADTDAGSWLRLLTRLISEEVDAETILDFVAHPLSTSEHRAILSQIVCQERIITADDLRRFCQRNRRAEWLEVTKSISGLFRKLDEFTNYIDDEQPALPSQWTQRFEALAEEFLLPKKNATEDHSAPHLAQSIRSFVQDLLAIESIFPKPMRGDEFLKAIDRYLLGTKVRDVGDPLAGIQVLGLTEARHMPFALTILLGCTEGNFPRAVPRDALVDPYLQTRLGLPGWRQLEAMEDTTFGLLHERLPAVIMTYPINAGDSPTVRSRFLDRLVNNDEAQVLTPQNASRYLGAVEFFTNGSGHPARPEKLAESPSVKHLSGIEADTFAKSALIGMRSSISATSLTQLIECPYAYALKKLGVSDQTFHRDDDRRAEGEWLHEVLEAFFTGESKAGGTTKRLAPDLPSFLPLADFEIWAIARLQSIAKIVAPPAIQETALWLRLMSHSFPRFAAHVKKIWTRGNQITPTPGWKEFRITAMVRAPADVSGADEPLTPATGSVDAVDFCESAILITDYKRSGTPDGPDVERGFALQLPFYVHALQQSTDPPDLASVVPVGDIITGYWSILDGEFFLAGTGSPKAFDEAKNLGLISRKSRSARDLGSSIAAFRRNWRWRLDEIKKWETYLPDDSACRHCQLAAACRKNDPQMQPLFKSYRRLELLKNGVDGNQQAIGEDQNDLGG